MNIKRFRVSYLVEKGKLHIPPLSASMVRGAFGHNLRRMCCNDFSADCHVCSLNGVCSYAVVFEPSLPLKAEGRGLQCRDLPRPFIIDCPRGGGVTVKTGEGLSFELTLIGPAIKHRELIVQAFVKSGSRGFGKQQAPCRLSLLEEWNGEGWSVDGSKGFAGTECDIPRAFQQVVEEGGGPAKVLTVNFQTPSRLKKKGKVNTEPTFEDIVRAVLRRLGLFEQHYGTGHIDVDYQKIVELARKVNPEAVHLKWSSRRRVSGRQHRSISMSGIVGELRCRVERKRWLPLLRCGSMFNIGKGASFGMGRYTVMTDD